MAPQHHTKEGAHMTLNLDKQEVIDLVCAALLAQGTLPKGHEAYAVRGAGAMIIHVRKTKPAGA